MFILYAWYVKIEPDNDIPFLAQFEDRILIFVFIRQSAEKKRKTNL